MEKNMPSLNTDILNITTKTKAAIMVTLPGPSEKQASTGPNIWPIEIEYLIHQRLGWTERNLNPEIFPEFIDKSSIHDRNFNTF